MAVRTASSTLETISSISKTFELPSILPFSSHILGPGPYDNFQWYDRWIRRQIQEQPEELFSTISIPEKGPEKHWTSCFGKVWEAVALCITTSDDTSIDSVIANLVDNGNVDSIAPETHLITKNLVFAIIGWQTMLYIPDIHSCPPSQLAINSQMGSHQGQAHMSLKQAQSSSRKHIHEFLLGFGMLLPPRNFSPSQSTEDEAAFNELTTVAASSFNAHFLTSIGGITIEWVDSLPCHLEFDPDSNTLFLFGYPSFCCPLPLSGNYGPTAYKSVLQACAAPYAGSRQWATEKELAHMLLETVLSYRLLFGQNKTSRQFFRNSTPFHTLRNEDRDSILTALCTQKHSPPALELPERDTYDLRRDFPILRSKLTVLMNHLSSRKPRTWKDLWLDKRDSASWLTFWAVLIIGGLGLALSFLQVILQIIQIVKQ